MQQQQQQNSISNCEQLKQSQVGSIQEVYNTYYQRRSSTVKKEDIQVISIDTQKSEFQADKCLKNKQTKKQYLNQYKSYFESSEAEADHIINSFLNDYERCIKHKIIALENPKYNMIPFNHCFVQILGIQNFGTTVTYQIQTSVFKIQIYMLNVINSSIKLCQIGGGQYGKIYKLNFDNSKQVAAKRITFKRIKDINNKMFQLQIKPNKQEIKEVLMEYSIYKICSFFQIGPATITIGGFDLICFSDAIEFYMQECSQQKQMKNISNELKVSLRILHKLKIIHKDIKPENILFSYMYNKNVFTDFGISHTIISNFGYLSWTYKEGTPLYMSYDMKNMSSSKQQIDLYHNDYICLKKSLNQMLQSLLIMRNKKLSKKTRLTQINQFYKYVYIFGVLIGQTTSQFIELVNELNSNYSNLQDLKQILKCLRKENLSKILQMLETINMNININIKSPILSKLMQLINKILQQKKSNRIQVNHLNFLIRIEDMDANILKEYYYKNQSYFPQFIGDHILQLYQKYHYSQPQYFVFIAPNQNFEKYLKKCLVNIEMNQDYGQHKLKLYLMKNLIQIEHKIQNTMTVQQTFSNLVEKLRLLDDQQEYNRIIDFYESNHKNFPEIFELESQIGLQKKEHHKILDKLHEFTIFIQVSQQSYRQLFLTLLKQIISVSTVPNLFIKTIFRKHEINRGMRLDNKVRYVLLEGKKTYLSVKQYAFYLLINSIQKAVSSRIEKFDQFAYMIQQIQRYIDQKSTNLFLLEYLYLFLCKYYKTKKNLQLTIYYTLKYLDAFERDLYTTTFEICEYYCQISLNYFQLEDIKRAIEYYLKILNQLQWSIDNNNYFLLFTYYKLALCYFWIDHPRELHFYFKYQNIKNNMEKMGIHSENSLKLTNIVYSHNHFKQKIRQITLDKYILTQVKLYIKEIIYQIKILCQELELSQQGIIQSFVTILKQMAHNQQFDQLNDKIQEFINNYFKKTLKQYILLQICLNKFNKKEYCQSLKYYKLYVEQSLINPTKDVLHNTYQIITNYQNTNKLGLCVYLIHKCLNLWKNHQIYCLYIKLSTCYKKVKNSKKLYKKYTIKSIQNKHSICKNKQFTQKLISITKDLTKYQLYQEAFAVMQICKEQYKIPIMKFSSSIRDKLHMRLLNESNHKNQKGLSQQLQSLKLKKESQMRKIRMRHQFRILLKYQ